MEPHSHLPNYLCGNYQCQRWHGLKWQLHPFACFLIAQHREFFWNLLRTECVLQVERDCLKILIDEGDKEFRRISTVTSWPLLKVSRITHLRWEPSYAQLLYICAFAERNLFKTDQSLFGLELENKCLNCCRPSPVFQRSRTPLRDFCCIPCLLLLRNCTEHHSNGSFAFSWLLQKCSEVNIFLQLAQCRLLRQEGSCNTASMKSRGPFWHFFLKFVKPFCVFIL